MIRVNLLPAEKRKAPKASKARVKREIPFTTIIIGLLLAAIVSALCFWYYLLLDQQIEAVNHQADQVRADIARLNITIQEVERLEAQISELKQKIQIIENLQEAQTGPVIMMDELARALPQRVWIESVSENGVSISIKGVGADNIVVASFMENLERSAKFRRVELSTTSSASRQGYGGETLKSFQLSALIEKM